MSSSTKSPNRLPLPRVLAFAGLNVPLAGVALPLTVYLAPLYANEVGLGLEMTGLLFMLLRFWDIFTDPVLGIVVDRYQSRWGRVRHWIFLSAPILALATYFAYMPPREGAGPFYFAFWMFIFYIGFTLLQTSRNAWVPAIAEDYDERSRLFFWPEMIGIATMLVLMALPALLPMFGYELDRFDQVAAMGWVLIVAIPITVGLALIFVPDRPLKGAKQQQDRIDLKGVLKAVKNKLLGRVLAMELLVGTAVAVTGSNYLFVTEYAFGLDDSQSSLVLMLFFIMSIAGMPFWLNVAKRTEKTVAFRWGCFLAAGAGILYYVTAQYGGFGPILIGAVVNGFAFSAPIALTRSMTADVVELRVAETGDSRAGIYFALLSVAYKLGTSLAFGVGYLMVGQLAGFHPGQANSDVAVHGLLLIFCVIPAVLYLAAAWVSKYYPITRAMQQETSLRLDPRGPMPLD